MLRFLLIVCGWMLLSSAVYAQKANPYVWVQLNAPASGMTLTAPANIVVTASAGTIDDGVSVSSITLYQNGAVIARVNNQESISFAVNGVQAGTHQCARQQPGEYFLCRQWSAGGYASVLRTRHQQSWGNRNNANDCSHGRDCGRETTEHRLECRDRRTVFRPGHSRSFRQRLR
ncbi:Ig-like domain-containing protein [Xanthomonas hydrangeae]|uniref:Ig-like domain-containing protein n=1 Tax=Xanthomonas hydrangeae TaxID=2775159 RepID=UPI0019662BE4